jgi:hypothetical protein
MRTDFPEYAVAGGFPYVKRLGNRLVLVGLDSTRVSALSQYFVGRLGDEQLGALKQILDDPRLQGKTVLVLCHHGPVGPQRSHDWRESGLIDAKGLLAAMRGRPVVLHHGHSHQRYWHPAANGDPHLFGGGSSTEPGRAGFWLVDLEDHQRLEARAVPLQR